MFREVITKRLAGLFFASLLLVGTPLALNFAIEKDLSIHGGESHQLAARYQTRSRTSNFFARSRISSVRG